jgi:putative peptide zinc metalloprotease protein
MKEQLLALASKKLLIAGVAGVLALAGVVGVAAETGTLSTLTGGASPSASPQAASTTATDSAVPDANAGGKNVVQVVNHTDGRFAVDGRVQLNRIPAPNAGPANLAMAYSQCTNCQTLALALQINLISTSASNVQPQNAATAVNVLCNGCVTVAHAVQYNISVDDPNNVPPSVNQLVARMRAELAQIKTSSTSITEAESRFNAVIAQFNDLAAYLKDARQQETAANTPGATPLPSSQPSASESPTSSPSTEPSASASASSSP